MPAHRHGSASVDRRRRRSLGKVLLQEVDEAVGGRVVRGDLRVVLQLRLDLLGQLLPELHPEEAEAKPP